MYEVDDVERLRTHIVRVLGPQTAWSDERVEWPGQIELALLDSVFSMRAHYRTVLNVIARWRARPDAGQLNDLRRIAGWSAERFADLVANHQPVPGGSQTKAAAAIVAARNLVAAGVTAAEHVADDAPQRDAFCQVSGLGPTSWSSFLMAIGTTEVEPDALVRRFVESAVPFKALDAARCRELVAATAAQLDTSATSLGHAIRRFEYQHHG